jgi:hypothetical protein
VTTSTYSTEKEEEEEEEEGFSSSSHSILNFSCCDSPAATTKPQHNKSVNICQPHEYKRYS